MGCCEQKLKVDDLAPEGKKIIDTGLKYSYVDYLSQTRKKIDDGNTYAQSIVNSLSTLAGKHESKLNMVTFTKEEIKDIINNKKINQFVSIKYTHNKKINELCKNLEYCQSKFIETINEKHQSIEKRINFLDTNENVDKLYNIRKNLEIIKQNTLNLSTKFQDFEKNIEKFVSLQEIDKNLMSLEIELNHTTQIDKTLNNFNNQLSEILKKAEELSKNLGKKKINNKHDELLGSDPETTKEFIESIEKKIIKIGEIQDRKFEVNKLTQNTNDQIEKIMKNDLGDLETPFLIQNEQLQIELSFIVKDFSRFSYSPSGSLTENMNSILNKLNVFNKLFECRQNIRNSQAQERKQTLDELNELLSSKAQEKESSQVEFNKLRTYFEEEVQKKDREIQQIYEVMQGLKKQLEEVMRMNRFEITC